MIAPRRLRVLDVQTPLFFAVIFFRERTGRGMSFELAAYDRRGTRDGWGFGAMM